MNDRIKALAEQARIKDHWSIDEARYLTNYLDEKKFAELIVRECTNVALEQKKQVEEMEVYNLQDEVWNRARIQQSEHIVDKIKQHFGVEE
jgi:hypothetical protein